MGHSVIYLVCFAVFFLLHYLEGMVVGGGLTVAQIWKMPVLIFLILYIISRYLRSEKFVKANYWLTGEVFLNQEIFINPMGVFVFASKLLPFPLFFTFFSSFSTTSYKKLETILYSLAQFIALTSALTLFGIVNPLKGWIEADNFGENLFYYSSVFGNPHPAASYFCISLLVLINGFKVKYFRKNRQKIFNFALILIGLVSLLKAYVRTGWLMLIVGLVILFWPSKFTLGTVRKFIVCVFVLTVGVVFLFQTNDNFRSRIIGHNVEKTSSTEIETSGSGRDKFWKNGVELWADGNIYQILFGRGTTDVQEYNQLKTGMPVGSHNLFVDMLSKNGLFGLFLLLFMYYNLNKYIKRYSKYMQYRSLALAVMWGSIIFAMFQSEMYFIYALILGLIVAILKLEAQRKCC